MRHLREFFDRRTRRFFAICLTGEGLTFVPLAQASEITANAAIETADLVLRCFQIGIAAITLLYAITRYYFYVRKKGE